MRKNSERWYLRQKCSGKIWLKAEILSQPEVKVTGTRRQGAHSITRKEQKKNWLSHGRALISHISHHQHGLPSECHWRNKGFSHKYAAEVSGETRLSKATVKWWHSRGPSKANSFIILSDNGLEADIPNSTEFPEMNQKQTFRHVNVSDKLTLEESKKLQVYWVNLKKCSLTFEEGWRLLNIRLC